MKIIGLLILGAFYGIYFAKMFMQRRRGIQTNQMLRGKHGQAFGCELIVNVATHAVVVAQIVSIILAPSYGLNMWQLCWALCGLVGVAIFAAALITMADSWRVGIDTSNKTEFVTNGIYKVSRNPAFLGFDCMYIGILMMFFNWWLLLFSAFAIFVLHMQILSEEQFLYRQFGKEYIAYKNKVNRYFGRIWRSGTSSYSGVVV